MKKKARTKKQEAYTRGLLAESMAAFYLRLKGYRILHKRYKTPVGEIDLIAKRKKTLVIVEVKTRKTLSQALESVTPRNRIRVEKATRYFLMHHPDYAQYDIRFDIIAGIPPFYWQHLDNAWQSCP